MLNFMYTGTYHHTGYAPHGPSDTIGFGMKLYALASKYFIAGLRAASLRQLHRNARSIFSKRLNGPAAVHMIRFAYCSLPDEDRELRRVVLRYSSRHGEWLFDDGNIYDSVKGVHAFWKDMLGFGSTCERDRWVLRYHGVKGTAGR